MPVYVALVLPSVSAHCALMRHCTGHRPYSPPGQSGRSTPRARAVCAALFGKQELMPRTPFQCCLVNLPPPPSLPLQPTSRGSQPHGTTCYVVATGFLHPVEPQAPLTAGYPADYTSCILDPIHCTNCLAVHTIRAVHCLPG